MKTSNQYLQELIENEGENWKQTLDAFFRGEEDLDSDIEECILNFLNACKEEIIDNKKDSLKKIEKVIDNDLLYKSVRGYVEDMLYPYHASAPLRTCEVKDSEAAVKHIEEIFNHAILRFNPNISQKYSEFGFENEESFIDFLNVFDSMCTFVISRNLHCESIEQFIERKTKLPKKLCTKITELINMNFNQLQLNFIIERLNKME